jgi:uncharacterized protein (DUF983 family)
VVLRVAGGVRPAAPVPSAPLDDIPNYFCIRLVADISIATVYFLKMYEDETVNYGTWVTMMWRK